MRDFAALVTGSLVGVQTAWVAETLSPSNHTAHHLTVEVS